MVVQSSILLAHLSCTYHISFLREDGVTNTLRGKPLDGEFDHVLLTLSEIIFGGIHALRESKVSHFDHKPRIDPVGIIIMLAYPFHQCLSTHMQFLAARSLCMSLFSARYSMPLPT